jgi:hypothetical protein
VARWPSQSARQQKLDFDRMRARRGDESEALKQTLAELTSAVSELRHVVRPTDDALGQRLDDLDRRIGLVERELGIEPSGNQAAAQAHMEVPEEALPEAGGDAGAEPSEALPEAGGDAEADPSVVHARAERAARLKERAPGPVSGSVGEGADPHLPSRLIPKPEEAGKEASYSPEKLERGLRKQRSRRAKIAASNAGSVNPPSDRGADRDEEDADTLDGQGGT